MNEASTDAWFYTSKGERLGPVGKHQLRELADEGNLNPRHDLCWTQGMEEWQPAGTIPGLYDKATVQPEETSVKPTEKSYRPPRDSSKLSESELELELLNADWPGATRRVYLFAVWVLPLLVGGGLGMLAAFFGDSEDAQDPQLVSMVAGLGSLLFLVLIIFISLQRLKNLGMSRWWFLGNFVPLLNLWVGYRSVCCPAGYEFHRKLDGIGTFLAILYWGLIVLFVVVSVLAILAMLGIVGGGMFEDFQKLFESAMEEAARQGEGGAPSEE